MAEKIGRYEALAVIGRGGMGMIYKARDPVLERSVALKVISSFEVTADLRARFFREARACARLRDHPNIVTIHDMGEDDGRLFIVMELLEGEELRRLIARPAPLTLEEKLAIVRQICDGLHHAHQKGVVHRDIKPANIFLLPSGQVKILDFGIAQFAAAATTHGDLTRTGMMMGTPRYMAPEQVRGQADQRSDIFSVGAVAYELFSGRPPFAGDNPLQILDQLRTVTPPRLSELDPSLPPELSDIVDRAIRKGPEERFADLGEMGRELEAVQRGLGEGPKRVPVVPTGAVAEPPSLRSEIDHAESTDRWPSRGVPTAWDTGETSVSRAPRIAIATGVAIAASSSRLLLLANALRASRALADSRGAGDERGCGEKSERGADAGQRDQSPEPGGRDEDRPRDQADGVRGSGSAGSRAAAGEQDGPAEPAGARARQGAGGRRGALGSARGRGASPAADDRDEARGRAYGRGVLRAPALRRGAKQGARWYDRAREVGLRGGDRPVRRGPVRVPGRAAGGAGRRGEGPPAFPLANQRRSGARVGRGTTPGGPCCRGGQGRERCLRPSSGEAGGGRWPGKPQRPRGRGARYQEAADRYGKR
jgi:serine/threonine-protein kinase